MGTVRDRGSHLQCDQGGDALALAQQLREEIRIAHDHHDGHGLPHRASHRETGRHQDVPGGGGKDDPGSCVPL